MPHGEGSDRGDSETVRYDALYGSDVLLFLSSDGGAMNEWRFDRV